LGFGFWVLGFGFWFLVFGLQRSNHHCTLRVNVIAAAFVPFALDRHVSGSNYTLKFQRVRRERTYAKCYKKTQDDGATKTLQKHIGRSRLHAPVLSNMQMPTRPANGSRKGCVQNTPTCMRDFMRAGWG